MVFVQLISLHLILYVLLLFVCLIFSIKLNCSVGENVRLFVGVCILHAVGRSSLHVKCRLITFFFGQSCSLMSEMPLVIVGLSITYPLPPQNIHQWPCLGPESEQSHRLKPGLVRKTVGERSSLVAEASVLRTRETWSPP